MKKVIWTAVPIGILILAGLVALVFGMRGTIHEAYSVEWVGSHIIAYMEENGGAWPVEWEDLREIHAQRSSPWGFETLQRHVIVDWQADPSELVQMEWTNDPPFLVVRGRAGSGWRGGEPNARIKMWLDENKWRY